LYIRQWLFHQGRCCLRRVRGSRRPVDGCCEATAATGAAAAAATMPTARMPRAIRIRHMIAFPSVSGDLDDRLAASAPTGGERGGRFRECQDGPDDRLEPPVAEPLSEVREPGTVGFDDEENGPPVLGPDFRRGGDGDERAAGAHERGRA